MLKRWAILFLAGLLMSMLAPGVGASMRNEESAAGVGWLTPRSATAQGLVVRFKDHASIQSEELARSMSVKAGVGLSYQRAMSGGAHVFAFDHDLPVEEARVVAEWFARDPLVESVEPDRQVYADIVPNDSAYSDMWSLAPAVENNYGIDAPAAWDITTGDPELVVAVIDTGILAQHPDLSGRVLPGYDFISDAFTANDGDGRDPDATDAGDWVTTADGLISSDCVGYVHSSTWHGSHVAGTIAAVSNNGLGVTGINWNSKILPLRVLGKCGGTLSDVVDAMRWAAGLPTLDVPPNPTPARVINMSLGAPTGGEPCSNMVQSAVNDVTAAGVVVVVSAGNAGADASNSEPANCAGVITVGASEMGGNNARYSNTGTAIEIGAPGGDASRFYIDRPSNLILSTVSSSQADVQPDTWVYRGMQGTSMASPHIAGIVSLMRSVKPDLSSSLIARILQDTATPYNPSAPCALAKNCGRGGIANAGRAVQRAADLTFLRMPNDYALAFAGAPQSPNPIQIVTAPSGNPSQTVVTIGGIPAQVLSVQTSPEQDVLWVQAPTQPSNGFYPVTVSMAGRSVSYARAVFYGYSIYLDTVMR